VADPYRQRLEWQFLQCLCASSLPVLVRLEFCSRLRPEAFTIDEHRVIFAEVCAMTTAAHPASTSNLREQLAARITARGFPELEFSDLLRSEAAAKENAVGRIAALFERLRE
jgi:replicative DNA helicase